MEDNTFAVIMIGIGVAVFVIVLILAIAHNTGWICEEYFGGNWVVLKFPSGVGAGAYCDVKVIEDRGR